MRPALVAVLAAVALAVTACGDDNSGKDSAQSSVRTEPLPPASQTRSSDEPEIDLDNGQPAPAVPPKQRKKVPNEPKSKAQREAAQKQVYETSRFFCKTAGITGLQREYGISSGDPEAIAREAARRTYSRGDAAGVYSGCLAGLREAGK
jgi:hypothetical protein